MKLQEVFDQLRHGELSQLSIGGQPQGVVNAKNQDVFLNALNLGLTNLHTRFRIKEGRLKLLLLPDMYLYILKGAYALNNTESTESVRYIEGDFQDDLAKIEELWTEEGHPVLLNVKDKYSCYTPKTHVLRVPVPVINQDPDLPQYLYQLNALDVVYRQLHPKVGPDEFGFLDVEETEIDLPYLYLEPLLYFIAGRVHHPVGMTGEFHMGASYAAKYEQACQRLENSGMQRDEVQTNNRLTRNGWV